MEGHGQLHGVAVADLGQQSAGIDLVAAVDVQLGHTARNGGLRLETVEIIHNACIGKIGIAQGDLGLLDGALGIRTVDLIKQGILFHIVALFKIGGQNISLHQTDDVIGIGRQQGAAAADLDADVAPLGGKITITAVDTGLGSDHGAHDKPEQCRHQKQGDQRQFSAFFLLFARNHPIQLCVGLRVLLGIDPGGRFKFCHNSIPSLLKNFLIFLFYTIHFSCQRFQRIV